MVIATNDFSRRIFSKLGWEMTKQIEWDEFQVDGEKMFGKVDSQFASTHFVKLWLKSWQRQLNKNAVKSIQFIYPMYSPKGREIWALISSTDTI